MDQLIFFLLSFAVPFNFSFVQYYSFERILAMIIRRFECRNAVAAVSNPESILHGGRRVAAASCAGQTVGNLPTALQSLETALQEVATSDSRTTGKDTFDAIVDLPVSEEHPDSRTRLTHYAPSAMFKSNVHKQIGSVPASVEDAVLRHLGDAGRAIKSSPDMKVIAVIRAAVNKAVAKTFQSAGF